MEPNQPVKSRWSLITIIVVLFFVLTSTVVYFYLQNQQLKNQIKVTNFEECSLVKGAIIQQSYPATCVLRSGESFVQELSDEETNNIVKCGGWDSSGEIVCQCQGKLIKPECPQGRVCDSGDYLCQGECDSCCYKGAFNNPSYPKCQ